MTVVLVMCLGLVAVAASGTWWVAFGLAARTDRVSEVVLVGLVEHLDQFEAELDCAAVPALAAPATGGAA